MRIDDVQVVLAVHGEALGLREVPRQVTGASELPDRLKMGVEHLHPEVQRVGDVQAPRAVQRDVGGVVETPRLDAAGADPAEQFSVRVQHRHLMGNRVGHEDPACRRIDGQPAPERCSQRR